VYILFVVWFPVFRAQCPSSRLDTLDLQLDPRAHVGAAVLQSAPTLNSVEVDKRLGICKVVPKPE
jgi:hypothetical protein